MTLEQKLNTRCNILVKRAEYRAISTGTRREGKQLLPSEDAAVFVNNRKLTRDLAKTVRYEVGKEQARNYLMNKEGWTGEQFDKVDWNRLHGALGNKPEGHKTWLSKQHTGFCGTRVQVGYYNGNPNVDLSCPTAERGRMHRTCACAQKKTESGCSESVNNLEGWMKKCGKTDPEIS